MYAHGNAVSLISLACAEFDIKASIFYHIKRSKDKLRVHALALYKAGMVIREPQRRECSL